jgi:hypothetical protein
MPRLRPVQSHNRPYAMQQARPRVSLRFYTRDHAHDFISADHALIGPATVGKNGIKIQTRLGLAGAGGSILKSKKANDRVDVPRSSLIARHHTFCTRNYLLKVDLIEVEQLFERRASHHITSY